MTVILTSILNPAERTLGESLPRLAGAVVLLVVGVLVARLAGLLARRALLALGADRLAERFGIHDVLARLGLERSLSRVIGILVRLALTVVVVFAAASALGLGALSASLNQVLLFLPKLVVAVVLVLAGVIIGQFAGNRVDRLADQMALGGPLGRLTQAAIVAIFVLTALAQLGISTEILTAILGIVIVALALAVALAFGLGSRDVAREVSAGRYVGGAFRVGQTISVDGIRGEIASLETAATVLRTDDGRTVRIPNHLLLESIVTLHDLPPESTVVGDQET